MKYRTLIPALKFSIVFQGPGTLLLRSLPESVTTNSGKVGTIKTHCFWLRKRRTALSRKGVLERIPLPVHGSCASSPHIRCGLVSAQWDRGTLLWFCGGILSLQLPSFQKKTSAFSCPTGYLFPCVPQKHCTKITQIFNDTVCFIRAAFSRKSSFGEKPSMIVIKISCASSSCAQRPAPTSTAAEGEVWGSHQGQQAELCSHRLSCFPGSIRATIINKEENILSKSFWIAQICIYDWIIS